MTESAAPAGVTTKPQFENYYRWVEPDSNITVCLKLETVDRLQLEVLRGVDSFSYSGNEVGGILLGRTELDEGRILMFVDDFEPVSNEHPTGASYALTGRNAVHFEAALAHDRARQPRSVVGYYRSHNRDGLFLSKDDLQFIEHYFRGPDNLFLLIKTFPNRACTAGFFFWKDGHIQTEFTDSEAPLIPISVSSQGPSLSLNVPRQNVPPENLTVVSPPASSAAPAAAKSSVTVAEEGLLRKPGIRQQTQYMVPIPSVRPVSKGEFLERMRRGTRWFRLDSRRSDSDRRRARRESGDGLIAFYWEGGVPRGHRVRDISQWGAYVESDFSWMCGTLIVLTLQITSNGEPGNDAIVVPAEVVRTSPEGMGLKFSFSNVRDLRKLLQFLSRWNLNVQVEPELGSTFAWANASVRDLVPYLKALRRSE
jgi:hypothetical protein